MKPTGIAWLPEVPEEWEIKNLRQFLKLVSVRGKPERQLLSVTREKGVIVRDLDDDTENHNFVPEDLTDYKVVEVGDFVVNKMKAWQGSYGVSAFGGIVSPAYYTCKLSGVDGRFFSIAIRSRPYVSFFARLSKGIRVGQWDLSPIALKQVPFLFPPLAEQRAIVAFLDGRCGAIDAVVAAKERERALLKELKKAVIAEAVTGGVSSEARFSSDSRDSRTSSASRTSSPSSPAGRKTKPTGIAWLPEVPEEWEIRRMKSLFSLRRESYNPKEQLQVLSLLKDVGVIPYSEKGAIGNKSKEDYSTYNVARKGDIVMNSMNVIIGSVDITPFDGYISPAYYALMARDGVEARFYNYLFHTKALQQALRAEAKGILEIRLRVSTTSLFGLKLPYPPLAEQRAIVAFLDGRCGAIDAAEAALAREVAALKELKRATIAEAVTGSSLSSNPSQTQETRR